MRGCCSLKRKLCLNQALAADVAHLCQDNGAPGITTVQLGPESPDDPACRRGWARAGFRVGSGVAFRERAENVRGRRSTSKIIHERQKRRPTSTLPRTACMLLIIFMFKADTAIFCPPRTGKKPLRVRHAADLSRPQHSTKPANHQPLLRTSSRAYNSESSIATHRLFLRPRRTL